MPSYSNVVSLPGANRGPVARRRKRHLHNYQPGETATGSGNPRVATDAVPSVASRPMPSARSAPLSVAFDDDDTGGRTATGRAGSWSPGMGESEAQYLNGLGAESGGFFTDLFQTVAEGYKAKQQAKAAAAGVVPTGSVMARPINLPPPGFLGLNTTTWMLLAGAGLGAYLLLSSKKRRR